MAGPMEDQLRCQFVDIVREAQSVIFQFYRTNISGRNSSARSRDSASTISQDVAVSAPLSPSTPSGQLPSVLQNFDASQYPLSDQALLMLSGAALEQALELDVHGAAGRDPAQGNCGNESQETAVELDNQFIYLETTDSSTGYLTNEFWPSLPAEAEGHGS